DCCLPSLGRHRLRLQHASAAEECLRQACPRPYAGLGAVERLAAWVGALAAALPPLEPANEAACPAKASSCPAAGRQAGLGSSSPALERGYPAGFPPHLPAVKRQGHSPRPLRHSARRVRSC